MKQFCKNLNTFKCDLKKKDKKNVNSEKVNLEKNDNLTDRKIGGEDRKDLLSKEEFTEDKEEKYVVLEVKKETGGKDGAEDINKNEVKCGDDGGKDGVRTRMAKKKKEEEGVGRVGGKRKKDLWARSGDESKATRQNHRKVILSFSSLKY